MRKKIISSILAASLTIGVLAGCGKSEDSEPTVKTTPQTTSEIVQTEVETESEPADLGGEQTIQRIDEVLGRDNMSVSIEADLFGAYSAQGDVSSFYHGMISWSDLSDYIRENGTSEYNFSGTEESNFYLTLDYNNHNYRYNGSYTRDAQGQANGKELSQSTDKEYEGYQDSYGNLVCGETRYDSYSKVDSDLWDIEYFQTLMSKSKEAISNAKNNNSLTLEDGVVSTELTLSGKELVTLYRQVMTSLYITGLHLVGEHEDYPCTLSLNEDAGSDFLTLECDLGSVDDIMGTSDNETLNYVGKITINFYDSEVEDFDFPDNTDLIKYIDIDEDRISLKGHEIDLSGVDAEKIFKDNGWTKKERIEVSDYSQYPDDKELIYYSEVYRPKNLKSLEEIHQGSTFIDPKYDMDTEYDFENNEPYIIIKEKALQYDITCGKFEELNNISSIEDLEAVPYDPTNIKWWHYMDTLYPRQDAPEGKGELVFSSELKDKIICCVKIPKVDELSQYTFYIYFKNKKEGSNFLMIDLPVPEPEFGSCVYFSSVLTDDLIKAIAKNANLDYYEEED